MSGQRTSGLVLIVAALTLLLLTRAGHQHNGLRAAAAASTTRAETAVARGGSMSLIRGATFQMGTDPSEFPRLQQAFAVKRAELFSGEAPRHTVTLGAFYMDRHEVTNALYKKFLDRNPPWRPGSIEARYHNGNYLKHWDGNNYPKERADHPVTNVSWYAAVAYCRWMGKRLPTEAEWEYAARGGLSDKAFPWGDEPVNKTLANYGGSDTGTTTRVGSYPANGYGLFDMAGNVWEYTLDEWGPYASSSQVNPVAGGNLFLDDTFYTITTRRVIRGGSYGGSPVNLRTAYRDSHPPDGARDFVGFRCVKPAPSGKQ
jgi:formylglycine-generating enzyme required for sulfatase activity